MLISRLFAFGALFLTSFAARKSSGSTYDTYFAKQTVSSPVQLDDASYEELTAAPRDYSAAILLTAIDRKYACKLCRDFAPEWTIVGRSWQMGDKKGDNRVLFGTLDFEEGRNVFMKLQLQTAPILLLFPPTTGPNAKTDPTPKQLDFLAMQSAEQVHGWITRNLPGGDYPPIYRPVNYARAASLITLLFGAFTLGTVLYPYLLPIVQSRKLWAGISIILVLIFTSGHMFNQIRKVPYVTGNGHGGITYFAGGFSNQFGIETQIVAAMYALLSFAIIALALRVPRIKDARTQQILVIIWGSIIFGMYSFLMSVFRVKNGGYPFWLPPF